VVVNSEISIPTSVLAEN